MSIEFDLKLNRQSLDMFKYYIKVRNIKNIIIVILIHFKNLH